MDAMYTANLYFGRGLPYNTLCHYPRQVAEWHICLDDFIEPIVAGKCIIYSFGIDDCDDYTNYFAA